MREHGRGPTPPLRLSLVQFKPRKADVAWNLAEIRDRWLRDAKDTDILVFPETALTGYFLEGGVADAALPVEEVAEGLGRPGVGAPNVVLGFYERWRRGIYNSVACFEPGEDGYRAIHVHRKMFLPTYGVFEEARFADPGRE
ncbi:MAG: NAD+ synthase, partial [Gemmatimonadales bacterium]